MTKMIKMSLIAAVAVTGMTSVVNAQPLEEAIKGVDVSGMVRYRYDDLSAESKTAAATTKTGTQYNEYTMKIATKAKVNDIVTANVQIEALGVNAGAVGYESAHTTTDQTGDRDVNLAVTKANFSANLGFATVTAGKQSVPSPFVDNSSDDVTRGTGAVALIPAGAVTVAAGHFVNFQRAEQDTAATTGNYASDISALAVLGKVADVNFDAWYVTVGESAASGAALGHGGADAVSIGVKAAVAGINVDARYSKVSPDAANSTDGQLTKVVASTKIGAASLVAGLAMTNDKNSGVSLDGDNDAQSGFRLWQADLNTAKDATAFLIGAGMEVMPSLTVDAKYLTVAAKDGVPSATVKDADVTELLVGATYAMSKNFGVHARFSMYEVEYDNAATADIEQTRGRLELKYTF